MIACQQAALEAGHKNWQTAPFILIIQFRGNTETGQYLNIPNTTRYIPFNFSGIVLTTKETGTRYECTATASNHIALGKRDSTLKSDTSISGATVQQVLQTGEKSLQSILNNRLQQLKKDGVISVPDEIVILFPTDMSSSADAKSGGESDKGATVNTVDVTNKDILTKLGVTRSKTNQTLVQNDGECNVIGKSTMGFGDTRKADSPVGKDNVVYDDKNAVNVRANNVPDKKTSDMRFNQDTDIVNAINQVLIQSNYPSQALDPANLTAEGYRKWWRIDVQTYNVTTDKTYAETGTKPRIIVYRIVPANAHASAVLPPNTKPPGYDNLYKQAVKHYNYIYTGKNVDIIR